MAISQRRITNLDSFVDATASPRDTAALYFHKQVDSFYDVALAVARDFFARPQLYTKVALPSNNNAPNEDENGWGAEKAGPGVIETLARLRSRSGTDELLPSQSQRTDIYTPIFGLPGGSDNFDKLRDDLIDAATAFSERVFDTGVDMLRERVRTAHRPLKDYLLGLTGDSTSWSAQNPLEGISENSSLIILRDSRICAVFGIVTPPTASWPYLEDSNADKLLEEITGTLNPTSKITRQQASNRQRLAARGAEAIAAVLDYTENSGDTEDDIKSLNVLITTCYTWGAAKKALTNPA
jgi:hypothetical protein